MQRFIQYTLLFKRLELEREMNDFIQKGCIQIDH